MERDSVPAGEASSIELVDPSDALVLVPRPSWPELLLVICLAGTSGGALLAYAFGGIPLGFTVNFIAVPAGVLLGLLMLLRDRLYVRLRVLSHDLWRGVIWGLAGTLVYDVVRPVVIALFGFTFDPYGAIWAFGMLITGRPPDHSLAITAGWLYHFSNGISFGMLFAAVRPYGGPVAGMVWGSGLQLLMMLTYPEAFQIRLTVPGFVPVGLFAHGVWGAILGAGLKGSFSRSALSGWVPPRLMSWGTRHESRQDEKDDEA